MIDYNKKNALYPLAKSQKLTAWFYKNQKKLAHPKALMLMMAWFFPFFSLMIMKRAFTCAIMQI